MDDAPQMGSVHVRAWQAAYRGLMPDAYLDGLLAGERAAMWHRGISTPRDRSRVIIAERNGTLVGFAAIGPAGDPADGGDEGQLYSINVDPDHWRMSAGRTLLDAADRELAALGFREAVLWVHPGNQRARAFYERAGWTCDDAFQEAEVLGVVVPEVRYRRPLGRRTT
jgi:ribosomal protein S18 acetylase RimI-like enzyme